MSRADIKIFHGDCVEHMGKTPNNAYNLAICDPPYGINADKAQNQAGLQRLKANGKSRAGRGWRLYKESEWDIEIPDNKYWQQLFRISKDQIVWGGNYMTQYLPPSMGWIVWNKMQRDFSLADGELAWTSFNKALRIFDSSRAIALYDNKQNGGRFHPTQKPVALYKWLLQNYAKEGDKILDTHGGSMSIAIACWDLKFDLDIYEIDKDYYEAGLNRFNNHCKQGQLF